MKRQKQSAMQQASKKILPACNIKHHRETFFTSGEAGVMPWMHADHSYFTKIPLQHTSGRLTPPLNTEVLLPQIKVSIKLQMLFKSKISDTTRRPVIFSLDTDLSTKRVFWPRCHASLIVT